MSATLRDSPGLVAIRDVATNRDLLLDPQPLCVNLDASAKLVTLRIQNGPGGSLRLSMSADQPWLRPEQTTLDLPASAVIDLRLTVHPDGSGEFAVLQLAWRGPTEDFAEHVLVQRQRKPTKPVTTTETPDWMK
ncbi:MAG: hypothetical protein HZA46_02145 [Planctomycetales bacterium]|nr:hypothetical protein [Planctomycetales bacterium]